MILLFILKNKEFRNFLIFFLGFLAIYLVTISPTVPVSIRGPGNDAIKYLAAIDSANFYLSIDHSFYILVGIIFINVFGIFGVTDLFALSLLSCVFGSFSVGLVYLSSDRFLQLPIRFRFMTAIIFGFSLTFWIYSTIIEVATFHLAFILLSLYYSDIHPRFSIFFFFVACFASLTTFFYFFILFYLFDGKLRKLFSILTSLFIVLSVIFLGLVAGDPRSLLYSILLFHYSDIIVKLSTATVFFNIIGQLYYLSESFLFSIFIFVVGLILIYKNNQFLFRVVVIAILSYSIFLILAIDHGVHLLPIYPFIAITISNAFYCLQKKGITLNARKTIEITIILILLVNIIFSSLLLSLYHHKSSIFQDFVMNQASLYNSKKTIFLTTNQYSGALEYYLEPHNNVYSVREINKQNISSFFDESKEIYLLDAYRPE